MGCRAISLGVFGEGYLSIYRDFHLKASLFPRSLLPEPIIMVPYPQLIQGGVVYE